MSIIDEDMKMLLFAADKIHDALLAIYKQVQDIADILSESLECQKEEDEGVFTLEDQEKFKKSNKIRYFGGIGNDR